MTLVVYVCCRGLLSHQDTFLSGVHANLTAKSDKLETAEEVCGRPQRLCGWECEECRLLRELPFHELFGNTTCLLLLFNWYDVQQSVVMASVIKYIPQNRKHGNCF